MKKFLLLWVILCLSLILLPKTIDKFTPKTIYKEIPIYRVKEVVKEVLVYKNLENEVFKIEKIHDAPEETYKIEFMREFLGGCMIWGGHNGKRDFYLSVSDIKGYKHKHPILELRDKDCLVKPIIPKVEPINSSVTPNVITFIPNNNGRRYDYSRNCSSFNSIILDYK